MKKSILLLFVGLLLGAVAATYFFGGLHARKLPGALVKPPDQSGDTAGTVTVTIDEKFFDSLLGIIFRQLGPPQLKLSRNLSADQIQPAIFQNSCTNTVVLAAEGDNVKTGVRFTGGKITAPLAFSGSYSILGRCVQFKGTARASVDLSFDQEKQTVFGQLNVDEVALDDIPPIVSGLVTAFVRKTITERVNPFEVLRVSQLALSLRIQASGGSVKARVKDVRAEVQEGSLRLYLTYDFSAERSSAN
jgi:hypothetical protein